MYLHSSWRPCWEACPSHNAPSLRSMTFNYVFPIPMPVYIALYRWTIVLACDILPCIIWSREYERVLFLGSRLPIVATTFPQISVSNSQMVLDEFNLILGFTCRSTSVPRGKSCDRSGQWRPFCSLVILLNPFSSALSWTCVHLSWHKG